jgi:opacity protein-like surface antigen
MKFILTIACIFQSLVVLGDLYFGGELGTSFTEGQLTGMTIGWNRNMSFIPLDLQQKLEDSSIEGILFAGYGVKWHSFFLAGEVFGQFNKCCLKGFSNGGIVNGFPEIYITNTDTRLRVSNTQYGVDFRPGWFCTPLTLLYMRAGVARSHLQLKSDNFTPFLVGTNSGFLSLPLSTQLTKAAFRLGGGLEQFLNSHLAFRADYIFTDYGRIKLSGANQGISSEGSSLTLSNNTQVKHLQQHAFLLGLSYHFSPCLDDYQACEDPLYCGCYLGGALGGYYADGKIHGRAVGNIPTLFQNFFMTTSIPSHATDKNFSGTIFCGYGRAWHRLFLAGEIFGIGYNRHSLKTRSMGFYENITNGNQQSIFLETRLFVAPLEGGIDLRPGFLLTPSSLFYGRVGTSVSTIKATAKANFQGILPIFAQFWNLTDGHSKHTTRATLRLGGGVEQALSSKLHLRLDYCYTDYGRVKFNGAKSNLNALGNLTFITDSTSQHLFNHSLLLGLNYYFW